MGKSKELYAEEKQQVHEPAANTSIEKITNPLSLIEQTSIVNAVICGIKDGTFNALKTEISLKSLENIIKDIRQTEEVKTIIRGESEKYGKKFKMFGAEIENCQRTTYDYNVCDDSIYNELMEQKETLEAQIKIREKQLQSGCDMSTGEVLKQPISKTTYFLKIIFKKE